MYVTHIAFAAQQQVGGGDLIVFLIEQRVLDFLWSEAHPDHHLCGTQTTNMKGEKRDSDIKHLVSWLC